MRYLIKKLLFPILFICLSTSGFTQSEVLALRNLAETELINNNLDKALELLTQAEQYISTGSNAEIDGDCYYLSGQIYSKKNQGNTAIKYFQKSVSVYQKTNSNEKLTDVFYRIGLEYIGLEAFEKAANYYKKSYNLQKEQNSKEVYRTLQYIGNCFLYIHQPDTALIYYNILFEKASNKNDTSYVLGSLIKQVEAYKLIKRDDKALEKNLMIFEILEKQKNYKAMSGTMNNIGFNYVFLNKYTEAISAFEKSLEYGEKVGLSNDNKANIYVNIGVCMQNSGNIKEAIEKLQTALKIRTNQGNYKEQAKIENIIALIYYKNSKDLYNAGVYSESSIENAQKSGDKDLLKDCYDTYSKILQAGNDYEKALEVYKKYLALRDSMLVEQRMKEQYLSQRILDLEKNEKELKLKIADDEVKDLAMRQLKLEAEKKQKDIVLLQKQNELEASEKERILQSLKLTEQQHKALIQQNQIKDLETQKAFQELEIKRQEALKKEQIKEVELLKSEKEKKEAIIARQKEEKKKTIWILVSVIIISALILYGLFLTRKKNKTLAGQNELIKQKNEELNLQNEEINTQKEYLQLAHDEISQKKQEIERKNNEITDSIRYAHRIQTAVLPAEILISDQKPDHFVFWKPKDIVSGDFYWIKDIGNKRLIAVADCTGHGVPGAFMSMLGISFLNEIVVHGEISSAASILNELRNMIKNALRQTGKTNEQKDGMDLALCIIDSQENKLQYAGAYNSLFYIRNKELEVVAADRMPIGIHYREKPFTNHVIDIKEGDIFYLFSDGFPDQFGGTDGRKFLISNFKQLLLSIHDTPIEEQSALLEKILHEWMAFNDQDGIPYKQVDDILVVGVKI